MAKAKGPTRIEKPATIPAPSLEMSFGKFTDVAIDATEQVEIAAGTIATAKKTRFATSRTFRPWPQ